MPFRSMDLLSFSTRSMLQRDSNRPDWLWRRRGCCASGRDAPSAAGTHLKSTAQHKVLVGHQRRSTFATTGSTGSSHPRRADSWQPLHTPRENVSERL
jgi:hypothetical protein